MKYWSLILMLLILVGCKDEGKTNADGTSTEKSTKEKEQEELIEKVKSNPEEVDSAEIAKVFPSLKKDKEGKFEFRYNLKVGETYAINRKAVTKEKNTAAGKEVNTTITDITQRRFKVLSYKDGIYEMEYTLKSTDFSVKDDKGNSIKINQNSKMPENPNFSVQWLSAKAGVGNKVKFKMQEDGTVTSVIGSAEYRKRAMAKVKSELNEQEQKFVEDIFKQIYSDDAIKEVLTGILASFPQKPLKIGETAKDERNKSENGATGSLKEEYTLVSVDGENVKMKYKTTQKISGSQSKSGLTLSQSGNATVSGDVILDTQTGWVKDVTQNSKTKTVIKQTGGGESFTATTDVTETVTYF